MLILLIVLALLVVYGIASYNSLIGRRNRATQALSSIEVQLTQRYDLIPKLIETVKQFMTHERGLLEEIVRLRSEAMGSLTASGRVAADDALTNALSRLNVSVEAYPQIQASDSFVQLQRALNEVEAQLSAARRAYNGCATEYNNAVQMVPTSIIAGMMHFEPLPMFAAEAHKREDIDVRAHFAR